jgi:hypothetical protein
MIIFFFFQPLLVGYPAYDPDCILCEGMWASASLVSTHPLGHGLINNIDTKAKCCHLKKLTCKGTLWPMFIRIYRLEIQSVMLVFFTKHCKLFPL